MVLFIPPPPVRGVSKGNKLRPHIEIEFAIEDLPLAHTIKNTLNGGYINIRKNSKSCRLILKKTDDLLRLMNPR